MRARGRPVGARVHSRVVAYRERMVAAHVASGSESRKIQFRRKKSRWKKPPKNKLFQKKKNPGKIVPKTNGWKQKLWQQNNNRLEVNLYNVDKKINLSSLLVMISKYEWSYTYFYFLFFQLNLTLPYFEPKRQKGMKKKKTNNNRTIRRPNNW